MPRDQEKRRRQNRESARRRRSDPKYKAKEAANRREYLAKNRDKINARRRELHALKHPPKPKPPKPPMRYEERKKLRPQAEKTAVRSRAVKRGMARAKELRQKTPPMPPPPEFRAERKIDMDAWMAAMRGVA